MLTLALFSALMQLPNVWSEVTDKPGELRVVIVGDSTVCDFRGDLVLRGWGQFMQDYFDDTVTVFNDAKSGRSSKSFIQEGLWKKSLAKKPDIVLIQFGHNDSHSPEVPKATDAKTDFRDYLRTYIEQSRSIGATPILVTPMVRRTFAADRTLVDNLKPYADAMKQVGAETDVPVVDLHSASWQLVESLGPEGSQQLANAPDDATHFNQKGAVAIADLVMKELPALNQELKGRLKQR